MARTAPKPKLPSFDELMFSTQEERDDRDREKVIDIPLSEIDPFPEHPFKIRQGEELARLVESISERGVITPAIVRKTEGGRYELISGHSRLFASDLAKKETLPCIVREMDRDAAIIEMVDANLQRENVLPSEKAFSYKMKVDAIRRSAGRPRSDNSAPVGQNISGVFSRDIVAEESGDSKSQIQRYIRLTELIPELLDLVDDNKVAMRPAVEISYLLKEEQAALLDAMESEVCTPSHAQAIKIRKFSSEGRLNNDVISSIMLEEKGNQKETFKMPKESISRFFKPDASPKEIEDTIIKSLEFYRKRERAKAQER